MPTSLRFQTSPSPRACPYFWPGPAAPWLDAYHCSGPDSPQALAGMGAHGLGLARRPPGSAALLDYSHRRSHQMLLGMG